MSSEVTIQRSRMSIGERKDVENALAQKEKFEAFMEYVAICDHPEILDDEDIEEGVE